MNDSLVLDLQPGDDYIGNFFCTLMSKGDQDEDEDDLDLVEEDLEIIKNKIDIGRLFSVHQPIFSSLDNYTTKLLFSVPIVCYVTPNTKVVDSVCINNRMMPANFSKLQFKTAEINPKLKTIKGLVYPKVSSNGEVSLFGIIFT